MQPKPVTTKLRLTHCLTSLDPQITYVKKMKTSTNNQVGNDNCNTYWKANDKETKKHKTHQKITAVEI